MEKNSKQDSKNIKPNFNNKKKSLLMMKINLMNKKIFNRKKLNPNNKRRNNKSRS